MCECDLALSWLQFPPAPSETPPHLPHYTSVSFPMYCLGPFWSERLFFQFLVSLFRSEFKCYVFREPFLDLLESDGLAAPNLPLYSAPWCWGWNSLCKLHFLSQQTFLLGSTIGCIRPQGALQAKRGKKGLVFLPVYFCFCHCYSGNSNWF